MPGGPPHRGVVQQPPGVGGRRARVADGTCPPDGCCELLQPWPLLAAGLEHRDGWRPARAPRGHGPGWCRRCRRDRPAANRAPRTSGSVRPGGDQCQGPGEGLGPGQQAGERREPVPAGAGSAVARVCAPAEGSGAVSVQRGDGQAQLWSIATARQGRTGRPGGAGSTRPSPAGRPRVEGAGECWTRSRRPRPTSPVATAASHRSAATLWSRRDMPVHSRGGVARRASRPIGWHVLLVEGVPTRRPAAPGRAPSASGDARLLLGAGTAVLLERTGRCLGGLAAVRRRRRRRVVPVTGVAASPSASRSALLQPAAAGRTALSAAATSGVPATSQACAGPALTDRSSLHADSHQLPDQLRRPAAAVFAPAGQRHRSCSRSGRAGWCWGQVLVHGQPSTVVLSAEDDRLPLVQHAAGT